jgi:hypothetical protein
MTQIALKSYKDARNAHEKAKFCVCFEMLEEGSKFARMFFWCFQVENKVKNMYKISCSCPNKKTMQGNKKPRKT